MRVIRNMEHDLTLEETLISCADIWNTAGHGDTDKRAACVKLFGYSAMKNACPCCEYAAQNVKIPDGKTVQEITSLEFEKYYCGASCPLYGKWGLPNGEEVNCCEETHSIYNDWECWEEGDYDRSLEEICFAIRDLALDRLEDLWAMDELMEIDTTETCQCGESCCRICDPMGHHHGENK